MYVCIYIYTYDKHVLLTINVNVPRYHVVKVSLLF